MATKPKRKKAADDLPTLFDPLPQARKIPVSSVSSITYEPDPDDEPQATDAEAESASTDPVADDAEVDEVSARARSTEKPKGQRTKKDAAPVKGAKGGSRTGGVKQQRTTATDTDAAPARPRRKAAGQTRGASAETLATQQRSISVSEFFAKNRHLLGFDNKRKALLTTVKEAVDNALDACEEVGTLPELHIDIDQLAEERFRVTVRDNGPGIVKAQIPNIFGKLLYGSKFHRLKMSRGQQGIGISAAGMYGLLTTGKSVHITSRTSPKRPAHHFQIQIDTTKNKPDIIKDEETEVEWDRGTEVKIELVASYAKGRQSVDEYIEQTAIANPHAQIYYVSPTREHREFPRASQDLPDETREIKPHPHGIELGVLMKMLKEVKGVKLAGFLQREFCRVSGSGAQSICEAAGLSPKAAPSTIGSTDVEKLYNAMQDTRFMAPPTDCLAPIGIRNLLAGMLKEVKAEFFTATTRSPAVYRGNPFQIEVAIAYGGSLSGEQSARVIRFANRVPLLYQQSACAAFKSVLDVDWRNYGLSQPGGGSPVGPLVVMVHMASVWVPFTSESKEAIADYDEIRKEMKLAMQECGRKLATYVRRRRRQKLEAQRRDIFGRYIPDVAESLAALTGQSEERLVRDLRMIAKTRTAEADVELDEDGKPIERPAEEPDEVEQTLNGDDSTLIVPENEVNETPEELFEANGNGNGGKKRKSKRRRR